MDMQKRLEEIQLWEQLLGRYTGLLYKLNTDKVISDSYLRDELLFIRNCLIRVKGVDNEDVLILSQQIKELNG